MGDLTKNELLEKLTKLVQTDRDLNFLLSLDEKDMTTLLIALQGKNRTHEMMGEIRCLTTGSR